jgi:beta-lactamase class A
MQWKAKKKWLVTSVIILNVAVLIFNIVLLAKNNAMEAKHETAALPYLSKRIFAENPNDVLINFIGLRQELQAYANPQGDSIGVYFEYLPSGNSIGINSNEVFFGASLLKLPVAMKVYKLIEEDTLNADQKLTIQQHDIDKGFGDLWKRGAGAQITLGETLRFSVASSDNTADKLLRDLVKPRPVSDVFDYLDIPTDLQSEYGAGVTAKGFSSVLRALYLSSYLSYEHSNGLLQAMTTSPYTDRIVAGVPQGVSVAHKVGIYEEPGAGTGQVHSDCGIVYVPKRPYMLCIMSKADVVASTERMHAISKMVYEYVSSAKK